MKIELQVSLPDGYEATGEYRSVSIGEHYFDKEAKYWAGLCTGERSSSQYLILRKIEVPKKMRQMTEGEFLRVITTPHCVIKTNDAKGTWVVPVISHTHARNYAYGFIREDGTVDGPYRFEKEELHT
jgi:hypothetical protein